MALSAGQAESVRLYSGIESQPVGMENGAHGTATTWYKGDLVKTASGLVNAIASTGAITGIALAASSATTNADIDIQLLDPAAIYLMRVQSSDYSAIAYVGESCALDFTKGVQRVNADSASPADVTVVGIYGPDKHADGATGILEGRVLVRFNYICFTGI